METERVIDLKDMLYWILRQWRRILVGAMVIALLAGLYQVYQGVSTMLDEDSLQKAQNKYEIAIRDYEATGERLRKSIEILQEQSANQQEYNEKSILMKIDPMNKWVGEFQVYIDSKYQINPNLTYQNLDMTNRLISAYASYLRSGELYQEILEQDPDIDEIRFLTEIYDVVADPATSTITVNCVGAKETDVQRLLNLIKTEFAEQYEMVRSAIGDHDYNILTESVYSTIDLTLDETQKSNLLSITEYSNKIGETTEELTDWENSPKPRAEYGVIHTAKQAVKYVILGGVIGVIVMCIWFAVKYAVSDTVKTDSDWRNFSISLLGHIFRNEKKKKFLPGLDAFIDRIFGRTRTVTQEQSCTLAARSIGAALKEQGFSEAALVGKLPEDLAETLCRQASATEQCVSLRCVGDVLTDPAAARALEDGSQVLLLAERYVTRNADIEQTLTLLKAWGKTVLGAVVIE